MQYPFSPLDGYGPKRVSGLSDRQQKSLGQSAMSAFTPPTDIATAAGHVG
jgi:hypothetical protein